MIVSRNPFWCVFAALVVLSGCNSDALLESRHQSKAIDASEATTPDLPETGDEEGTVEKTQPERASPLSKLEDVQNGRALLIGCSRYPQLAEKYQLKGPANDVLLTKNLLIDRFGFPADHIVLLSEDAGGTDLLPTRANIQREWERLADVARPGDQIVVLMAGHGSQTPQLQQTEDDVEPDGLDEIFLPRNTGKWQNDVGKVENSILDDELRAWIRAVKATGASLFLVFDACHSGTMARGSEDEVKRELPTAALGVPLAAIQKTTAGATADAPAEETPLVADEQVVDRSVQPTADRDEPTVVALYASQSTETTIETELPKRGQNRKSYGLLTYTLNQVLTQAQSKLTYAELAERIHQQYVEQNRYSPTPVIEGNINHVVLGRESFPQRSRVRITGNQRDGWKVNAGALSGLTRGSVLAVYPPAGESDADKVAGHVRILNDGFSALEADVEPCGYADMPAPETLESGMRCETVLVDFGDQRLRLGIDVATEENEPLTLERRQELKDQLDLPDQVTQLVEMVDAPADAQWLLRYDSRASNQLFLVPASGWPGDKEGALSPLFGPLPAGDAGFLDTLSNSLRKVHRVQTLLRISGRSDGIHRLKMSVMRYRNEASYKDGSDVGEVIQFERGGINLYENDHLRYQLENTSRKSLDVTLLWIDADYGIDSILPRADDSIIQNQIPAGGKLSGRLGNILPTHTGREQLIAIAVDSKALDQPTDFRFLTQESIERTRDVDGPSPLADLLRNSMLEDDKQMMVKDRGLDTGEIDSYQILTKAFTTLPEPRPEAKPRFEGSRSVELTKNAADTTTVQGTPSEVMSKSPTTVRVFYGTNRKPVTSVALLTKWSILAFVITGLLGILACFRRRKVITGLACVAALASLIAVINDVHRSTLKSKGLARTGVQYGAEWGELQVGTCDVSIPGKHVAGELESPSIFRLEVREDSSKHVMIQKIDCQEDDEFYQLLKERVTNSPRSEVFLFIHGFNNSFEDAARRTAQMAHDLKYEGVPMFYSWPSATESLKYLHDQNAVDNSIRHLKKFVLDVSERSGVKSFNLIAHSMGNRAMTSMLKELQLEFGDQSKLFNQVILAAPDVDAQVFIQDIAPAIAHTANQLTLYASSNDKALLVSRNIHGNPRAGDSGDDLVVTPMIDTIDVSSVDTNLIGHNYYGSSKSIISDIYFVLKTSLPPDQRRWLVPKTRDGVRFWAFDESRKVPTDL